MRYLGGREWRSWGLNLLLSVASITFGLLCAEVTLRTFVPQKYEDVRTLTSIADSTKIWAPPAGATSYFLHPDNRERITLLRNNLGIRMERDVSWPELRSTTNVAFFGDSFTENVRLPTASTFPEVLKHLLNTEAAHFEVLNFGVGGYGPDQSYLRYRELDPRIRREFDHVVFVYYENDLRDLAISGISSLDQNGSIVLTPRGPRVPPFAERLREWHLTYLIIDGYNRLVNGGFDATKKVKRRAKDKGKPKKSADRDYFVRLFNALMLKWQADLEPLGGTFHIAIVPSDGHRYMADRLDKQLHAIDLHQHFSKFIPNFQFRHVKFANDRHWNETGNLLAAMALYAELAPGVGLVPLAETELVARLRRYYESSAGDWQPARIGRFDFTAGASVAVP